MPTAAEVVEALHATTGCITRGRLLRTGDRFPRSTEVSFEFADPAPLKAFGTLRSTGFDAVVTFRQRQTDLVLASYAYAILDAGGRELVAFHWQPGATFRGPDMPHMHVSAALAVMQTSGQLRPFALHKLHIPTGSLALPTVVRMLVAEFGVQPLVRDWERRLAESGAILRRAMRPD